MNAWNNSRRWSDHDHYWGPFTYARQDRYRPLSIMLGSGDDEYPGCDLRFSGFGHTLIVALPRVIRPWKRKVVAKGWDADTIARLGRDWYYDVHEREYGFTYVDGHLSVAYGRQTNDSSTEQRCGWFAPWTQWRQLEERLYDADGKLWRARKRRRGDNRFLEGWRDWYEVTKACPTVKYQFMDFDGEEGVATLRIEETDSALGTGWFKWLGLFKRRTKRSLDIQFSIETGERKGSWKGGTIGHGIKMEPGELHESAFRRYCEEHKMTFGSRV